MLPTLYRDLSVDQPAVRPSMQVSDISDDELSVKDSQSRCSSPSSSSSSDSSSDSDSEAESEWQQIEDLSAGDFQRPPTPDPVNAAPPTPELSIIGEMSPTQEDSFDYTDPPPIQELNKPAPTTPELSFCGSLFPYRGVSMDLPPTAVQDISAPISSVDVAVS